MELRFDAIDKEIGKINVALGRKVNWTFFFTALLSILGLLAIILTFMWAEVKTIGINTAETKEAVARLEGKLDPYTFIKDE